ncbi:MAG: transglutaminase N-terminal domain-containing protein [Ilumatobacteraceae bacterium]
MTADASPDAPPDATTPTPPLRFAVVHRTEYEYSSPMSDGYTVAHLLPRETPTQRVVARRSRSIPSPTSSRNTPTSSGTASFGSACTDPMTGWW